MLSVVSGRGGSPCTRAGAAVVFIDGARAGGRATAMETGLGAGFGRAEEGPLSLWITDEVAMEVMRGVVILSFGGGIDGDDDDDDDDGRISNGVADGGCACAACVAGFCGGGGATDVDFKDTRTGNRVVALVGVWIAAAGDSSLTVDGDEVDSGIVDGVMTSLLLTPLV